MAARTSLAISRRASVLPSPPDAGEQQHFLAARAAERFAFFLFLFVGQRIDLVERDDFGFVDQFAAIGFEFSAHDLVGLANLFLRAIDEMQQRRASFYVAQKARSESRAFCGAFDQAGNIGEHKAFVR